MPRLPGDEEQEAPGPDGRLALGADIVKTVGEKALRPTVRLAQGDKGGNTGGENLVRALTSPVVRPAAPLISQTGANSAEHLATNIPADGSLRPALLVSYVYLEPFLENKHRYHYRDWVMDSGAFSAHNSGTEIKLQDYIDCCKRLRDEDQTLVEVFSLDVIGDWRAGIKNTEEMWKQGVEAIPCFHYGEPWEVLKGLCKDYSKVAIGGCVGKRDKDKFSQQCFARVWPKKLHGFGFGSEKSIMLVPWHSVDATNWEIAPCKYGQWKAFGTQRVSVRGSKQNLRAEVQWYLDLEQRARERWKKEMALLQEVDARSIHLALCNGGYKEREEAKVRALGGDGPAERLAINGKGQGETNGALGPTVRLVGNGDVVTQRQLDAFAAEDRGE